MKTRVLGRTGIEVGELSLGGLFLITANSTEGEDAIRRAVDLGVNLIDTAPSYYDSEEVIGGALEKIQAPVIVSTKIGGHPKPFNAQDKDILMQSVESSLKKLKRDCLDILMIHEPEGDVHPWWTDEREFHGPVMDLMDELKRSGTIKHVGLGGVSAYRIAHVCDTGYFDVILTAFQYSLLTREAELEIIPTCKKHNMGIIVGSPLQQGFYAQKHTDKLANSRSLSAPRREQIQELYSLVDVLGMPLPELALRFVLSNPDIHTLLMGAKSVSEVEQNVASVENGPLDKEILNKLDEIYRMVPFRPSGEPEAWPFWNFE